MVCSVFWVIFLLCNSHASVSCLNEEGFALLSFKKSIKQDPQQSLRSWNSSDENPCSWNGITCEDEKVVSISIPKKDLEGSLPPALGSLSSLRHINLRNNKLRGSLPVELFDANALQSLVLYGNFISWYLPYEIGNLRYLQVLDLSQNSLNGSIPISLVRCNRLKALDLSHNDLTDSLPVGFGTSLSALEKLDLSYNRLNGSIPSDIGNLPIVQGMVELSHNLFSGTVPASLGNVSEKVYIGLAYNNLSGSIPQYGTLVNRGLAAFVGNPWLCGPPLNNSCSSNSVPTSDVDAMGSRKHISLSRSAFIAIVASDIVALFLIGLVFVYCLWRLLFYKGKDEGDMSEKGQRGRRECCCFRKENLENFEEFDLVPLDLQVGFSLDELMKASAFVLGRNRTGIMYKVVFDDGLTLAVRRLGEGGLQRFKEFQTEVEMIGKLRHPNVVTLRAYYWSFEEKLLIYDYIPNGNLANAIHGNTGTPSFSPLPWHARLKIIKGIAKGLAYLHEFSPKKYIHGDLKPTNILLGENMEPYISDFGIGRLSNIVEGSSNMKPNQMATKRQKNKPSEAMNYTSCYQAPEAQKLLKQSQKWDVYSYGVILLELISGRSPMALLSALEMDLVRWIHSCIEGHKLLSDVLDAFLGWEPEMEEEIVLILKIALACVHANAEKRPSMWHVCHVLERLATDG